MTSSELPSAVDLAAALGALIDSRRARLRGPLRIAFGLIDGGSFTLDTSAPAIITPGYRPGAAVVVLTNRATLRDLILGRLDPSATPGADQLLTWAGDATVWKRLAEAFANGQSTFEARLASVGR
jgi:hypothetical protein